MNKGHVLTGTPIAVNLWEIPPGRHVELYFLSHFHPELLHGLSPSWNHVIYTSNITAEILKVKMPYLSRFIQALDFGTSHVLPLEISDTYVVVTFIDANHCPGSIMLLLEGAFGAIIYTGHFRFYPGQLFQLNCSFIDCLYFDNTYCSPHCVFSTPDGLVDEIIGHIKHYIGKARIIIGSNSYGKEDILVRIHEETKQVVIVNESKMATLKVLGLEYLADIKPVSDSYPLMLIENCEVSGKRIRQWNNEMPTQVILLTAKYVGAKVKPFRKHNNVTVFPYSSHSSYNELIEFVKEVKPKKLYPIIEKPVDGMFDENQGSMESLTHLIRCVTEQLSDDDKFSIECGLTYCLDDTDEILNIIANLSPMKYESFESKRLLEACTQELSSKPNGSGSRLPVRANSVAENGTPSEMHNGKLNFRDNLQYCTDFPDDINEYFMGKMGLSVNSGRIAKSGNSNCENEKIRNQDNSDIINKNDGVSATAAGWNSNDNERDNSGSTQVLSRKNHKSGTLHQIVDNGFMPLKNSQSVKRSDVTVRCCDKGLIKSSVVDTVSDTSSQNNGFGSAIPAIYLSAIRKRQRKQFRKYMKSSRFQIQNEELFLNDYCNIVYTHQNGDRKEFCIQNKQLVR